MTADKLNTCKIMEHQWELTEMVYNAQESIFPTEFLLPQTLCRKLEVLEAELKIKTKGQTRFVK